MSIFKIYKASAGSGKTYSLVLEYILILIQNPNEYKHILAVTFTNDATEEMKHRVLNQLHILAQNPWESKYIHDLVKITNTDELHVQLRAAEALQYILHDYSNFNICTIDSFFQRILRAFARDIGLSAGYNLHLETETAIHEVTEKVIANTNPDHKQGKWLLKAAMEKIEDGKNWNFRNELRELFKETFREKFQQKEAQIQFSYKNEKSIEGLIKIAKNEIKEFEENIEKRVEHCNALLFQHQLTRSSFSGKEKSFYGWVNYLQNRDYRTPNPTFINALNNVDKWYAKSASEKDRESIIQIYNAGLNEALNQLYDYYQAHIPQYNSNLLITQNLTQFMIFEAMVEELANYKSENEILFITDTNQFINELIKDNDESFIFEKAGNYFHHYLIDEFQDTSTLQWENFRPLVSNSISQGYTSLVVGDVKQSIYRFRNGDWRLLHEKAGMDITQHEVIPLSLNFRSAENIIKFNNTIYHLLPSIVANVFQHENKITSQWDQKFQECYSGQEQKIPLDKIGSEGYIKLKFFTSEDEEEAIDVSNTTDIRLKELVADVNDALKRGFKPSDLAVLVFTRDQAQSAARSLQEYIEVNQLQSSINIVTQSSLSIANSHAIRLLTSAIGYLVNKRDVIALANVFIEYQLHYHKSHHINVVDFQNHPLIQQFIQEAPLLKSMPLSLLVNELISTFEIGHIDDEYIFIQYFKDAILDYLTKFPDDLTHFFEWWLDVKDKYQVAIPENENSLRILTIHKSKGLQFNLVFIPFADWNLDITGNKTEILWLDINKENHPDSIPTLPVRYEKRMLNSFYMKEYLENKFYNYLDKVNLFYVATTRAITELYIYSTTPKTFSNKDPKPNLKYILNELVLKMDTPTDGDYIHIPDYKLENTKEYVVGSKRKAVQNTANSGLIYIDTAGSGTNILDQISIKQNAIDLRDDAFVKLQEKREAGILFHQVLSQSNSKTEAIHQCQKLHLRNLISPGRLEKFVGDIKVLYDHPLMISVTQGYKVYAEFSLNINEKILKPDKIYINDNEVIVVDYKTGKPMPEHHDQVKEYCQAAKSVFKKPSTGYIYYTMSQEFIIVHE